MTGLPTIAIDPGHNVNPDIGASYQTYSEDKISLGVAQQLKLICDAAGIKTIDCLPKSASSVLDSLQQRCAKSNDGGATIYVSIHCNVATPTSGSRGCETYAISTAGKAIAANINREFTKLGFKDRGVKTTLDAGVPPYVIRNTNAIAILTEICFLDAAEDTAILNQKGFKAIAQAIFNGLTHGTSFDPQSDNHANDPVVPTPSLLVNAAKYYKGLPHQDLALRGLEGILTPTQLTDFKAAYSPIVKTQNSGIALPTPKPASGMTVADWIVRGDGSTSGVDGLSDQIIAEMGDSLLVRFAHPRFILGENCDPYFHPTAVKKLRYALDSNPKLKMWCNSAYRSPVRQFVLREFLERRINGITAAAQVGTGNHERGLAIDLKNYIEWQFWLMSDGWHWQGENDPMHFDISVDSNVPSMAIQAYQRLANHHGANLKVDGIWGDATRLSMLSAPAYGW
jgi:N-acetylmuramoyl-L-alanine amidase